MGTPAVHRCTHPPPPAGGQTKAPHSRRARRAAPRLWPLACSQRRRRAPWAHRPCPSIKPPSSSSEDVGDLLLQAGGCEQRGRRDVAVIPAHLLLLIRAHPIGGHRLLDGALQVGVRLAERRRRQYALHAAHARLDRAPVAAAERRRRELITDPRRAIILERFHAKLHLDRRRRVPPLALARGRCVPRRRHLPLGHVVAQEREPLLPLLLLLLSRVLDLRAARGRRLGVDWRLRVALALAGRSSASRTVVATLVARGRRRRRHRRRRRRRRHLGARGRSALAHGQVVRVVLSKQPPHVVVEPGASLLELTPQILAHRRVPPVFYRVVRAAR
mmetsp:Transcript_33315/g.91168  ORF Transcript_33315/g.91168 Transcript_33315/m.91168 type:complete len:331 (-) Transcript_33315:607-1599(-)